MKNNYSNINENIKKDIIDQSSEEIQKNNKLELVLDDIFENDKSSSVLSDKYVLNKYINLKNKKLNEKEWNKLFVKVGYKSGFNDGFSFKSADKINIIHSKDFKDVQKEISNIESFIEKQEKNIKLIHKQLNSEFNEKSKKDIQELTKRNIKEMYSQIDNFLEVAQDVVFNVEADWYYNKIYNNLNLKWFVKSPSFYNPIAINKIVFENIDQNFENIKNKPKYLDSNLYIDLNTQENISLFSKTLNYFVSNFNDKILEDEIKEVIFEKYINYLNKEINNLNVLVTENLNSLFFIIDDKKKINHLTQLQNIFNRKNEKFIKISSNYYQKNIDKKFVKNTEIILNFINEFCSWNKEFNIFINEKACFNLTKINDNLYNEINAIDFKDENLETNEVFIEKIKRYFLEKSSQFMDLYESLYILVNSILFYSKYIETTKIDKRNKQKVISEDEFNFKNTEQVFANEVNKFRYTSKEVRYLYNEFVNFDEKEFKNKLISNGNIFYLNETINKLFIILDYIYNSLKITLKRASEVNFKSDDINKKNKKVIEANIERSEYYLEILYKQFGLLNNRFDDRNFKNIDACINVTKNLIIGFSKLFDSSSEFEIFIKFKDLIIQDSEILKEILLVFKTILNIVKNNKKIIHYSMSNLNINSNKLVDKKNSVEIDFVNVDAEKNACLNCKELHSSKYFEQALLLDYKSNSVDFKKLFKSIVQETLKIGESNFDSLESQKYIFNKLIEVVSIEKGIIKDLTFISNGIASQISSVMLKIMFDKANYLLDNSSNSSFKRYAEMLSNNLLILKFSAIRLLILKNLQYHLFLLDKLLLETKKLDSTISSFDNLLKFNYEKIYDLSVLTKEIKTDSKYKNDRRISYLYCNFVKLGLIPNVNNENDIQAHSIISKLFPDLLNNSVFNDRTTKSSNYEFGDSKLINEANSHSNNGTEESVEITYFENKNPIKEPINYNDLINSLKTNVIDEIKIANIEEYDEWLVKQANAKKEELSNHENIETNPFINELEKAKIKDDFVFTVNDLYEIKDIWIANEFKMTMPKYIPTSSVVKKPFGFAKKAL